MRFTGGSETGRKRPRNLRKKKGLIYMTHKLTCVLLSVILILSFPSAVFAAPGGGSSSVSWTGATTITSATTQDGETYTSSDSDQNALLISTSDAVTITNPIVTKSGDSDGGDNCNFYGINSGIMVKGGSTATISGGRISTTAKGANGVFSYGGNGGRNGADGNGTTVIISDTSITTTGSNSGGIMTTGGGITKASNLTVDTSGQSSAAIRTDRGGGTVIVDGGSYTTSGLGSPAIYSTADITVSDATLTSYLSEGVCIEGKNSITLNDCDLTASNTRTNGNATFLDTIMIYQSMSGDADSGTSSFTMNGGTLTSNSGHVFHVTNTKTVITLSDVKIFNNDSSGILLSVCDDGWSGGSNIATLNASGQTLEGTILVGSDSALTLTLKNGSTYTGMISGNISNAKVSSVSNTVGTVNVTLDEDAKWYLTGDTYITSFTGDAANVINNGYTLFVNGSVLDGTTDSDDDSSNDDTDTGFVVTFEADVGCSIAVYATKDLTGDMILNVDAGSSGADVSRDGTTGEPNSSGEGQVNFVVTVADGYSINAVSATAGTYNNIKLVSSEADSATYVFRVTKITAVTTVNVATKIGGDDSGDDDEEGYSVQLTAPANAEIWVYNTQTVTGPADTVIAAGSTGTVYARSSSDGEIDTAGSGQVNFVVVSADGYEVDEVTATGSYKNLKGPDETGTENAYRITKITAGDVVVTVSAKAIDDSGDDTGSSTVNPFTDVTSGAYYYDAVLWAVENGVTVGTSTTTFSPLDACTRAQIVTFLWRAAGSPEPTITSCDFTDVFEGAYYYKAVLWAVENSITAGTSVTTFSPKESCTRAQVVTFLYRYAGSPSVSATSCAFSDISSSAYYYIAVLWAAETGVTAGTSATTFSPSDTCTRGQIVTFLYRSATGGDTDANAESGQTYTLLINGSRAATATV